MITDDDKKIKGKVNIDENKRTIFGDKPILKSPSDTVINTDPRFNIKYLEGFHFESEQPVESRLKTLPLGCFAA